MTLTPDEDAMEEALAQLGESAVQILRYEADAHATAVPAIAAELHRLAARVERDGYAGPLTRFGYA